MIEAGKEKQGAFLFLAGTRMLMNKGWIKCI